MGTQGHSLLRFFSIHAGDMMRSFLLLATMVAASSATLDVSNRELQEAEDLPDLLTVLIQAGSKLVVVECVTPACGPCNDIERSMQSAVSYYGGSVIFRQVDASAASDVTSTFSVDSYPTFLFFKNGREVDRVRGANLPEVDRKIQQLK